MVSKILRKIDPCRELKEATSNLRETTCRAEEVIADIEAERESHHLPRIFDHHKRRA